MLVGLILIVLICLLNFFVDPLVELLALSNPFAIFGMHLLLLVKKHKVKRAKLVLTIKYREWGFMGSSTRGAIVGKLSMGKKKIPKFHVLLDLGP